MFGHRTGAWPAALGDLLDTPRALKFTLSSVIKSWEKMSGEVDIDELIILTALRFRAGPAFSFVVSRAWDMRLLAKHGAREDDKAERERQLEELRSEWKDALSKTDANRFAVEILVSDLFPAAYLVTGRTKWLHSNRLQSVASSRGDIYIGRIAAGELPRNTVRDQTVLRFLHSVAEGHDLEVFAKRFVSSREFADTTIFFDDAVRNWPTEPTIAVAARLSAASAMIRVASEEAGDGLLYQHPTFHLVKHWIASANQGDNYLEWATHEIVSRIPKELMRATELYFDLFRDMRVGIVDQSRARGQILEKAKESFVPLSSTDFAKCFPANFPYTLSHLVRLDKQSHGPPMRLRLADWSWLATKLLKGIEKRPDILIPHSLALFGTFGPQPGPFSFYRFRDEDVSSFFGSGRDTFYQLIQRPFTPSPALDPNFALLLPLSAQQAGRILAGEPQMGDPADTQY